MKIFAMVFSAICGAGVFVGLASGIEWGTASCGFLSATTLLLAGMVASATAFIQLLERNDD